MRPIDHEIEDLLYALDHLNRGRQSTPVSLEELMERAYGSKDNFLDNPGYDDPVSQWKEYRQKLKEDLRELNKLGWVNISDDGYSTTEKAEKLAKRELELYDLDGFQKPFRVKVTQWAGLRVWHLLNRVERSYNPYKDFDAYDPGVEEDFVIAFAQRSLNYLFWIVVFSVSFVLMSLHQQMFLTQGYGLGLDILGALILARAVIRGKANIEIESESSGLAWRENVFESRLSPEEAWVEAIKTVDGVWGAALLTVGFVIQIGGLYLSIPLGVVLTL